jgi:galactokinase
MAMTLTTRTELFFGARVGRDPDGSIFVPGRARLFGAHAAGDGHRVLDTPLEEGIAVVYGVRPDTRIAVWSLNAKAKDRFGSGEWLKTGRHWSDLARGACASVAADGDRLPGFDLVVQGDLPQGAGLASSTVYVVALLRALRRATERRAGARQLAAEAVRVETEWSNRSGTAGDAYVAAAGTEGELLHLDPDSLEYERLPLPPGICVTTEAHGAESNTAAVAIDPEGAARYIEGERGRVQQAVDALRTGNAETLVALLEAGHRSLIDDLAPGLADIDTEVARLAGEPGVLAARLQDARRTSRVVVLEQPDD